MNLKRGGRLAASVLCAVLTAAASWAASSAMQQGLADLDAKDYAQAQSDLRQAIHDEPRNSAVYFLMGYAHYEQGFSGGNPETADKSAAQAVVTNYQKVLALDPTLQNIAKPYELYFTWALSYEALGQNDQAFAEFKAGINAAPDNFLIPLYAARLRFLNQNIERAKANLALSLKRAQDQGDEADLVKMMKTSPLFSSMANNAVLSQLLNQADPSDSGAADGALHDSIRDTAPMAQGPSLSPDDRAVLSRVAAGAIAVHNGNFMSAISLYKEALALNAKTETLGNDRIALVEQDIGTCYRTLGLTALSADYFGKAAARMPFDAEAHYQLALADGILGRTEQSLSELDWSLKTAPSNADLRRYLLLSKVESDFGAVRDLPGYAALASRYSGLSSER